MRYLIVLNEDAGQAGKTPPGGAPDELRAAFALAGVDAEVRVAEPTRIQSVVRAAIQSPPDALIVSGGDGTVRSAAQVLAGTGLPLGVLPTGTFNHFAKDLGMPVNLAEAVPALAGAVPRAVDLGEVNGHVFINNCSIGAYAQAVRRRESLRDHRGLGKWRAMVRASWEEFRRLRRMRLRIKVERTDPSALSASSISKTSALGSARSTFKPVRTPVVVIGNNRYSGRLLSQHLRPRLDEGQLWLYTVRAHRRLAVLRMMVQSFVRRLDEVDALNAEPASEIVIASEHGPTPVAADGELLALVPPFCFRIRPGALRVLAPVQDGKTGDGGPVTEDRERRTEDGARSMPDPEREPALQPLAWPA